MPTLMARGCSPELATRVRRYAREAHVSTSQAISDLLAYALDQRAARSAGAQATNAGRTQQDRSAAATRAVGVRWYPLRDTIRRLATQPDAPIAAKWMADELAEAEARILSADDHARIDAYAGGAADLHELLASVVPLRRSRWYESRVTAQRGTEILMGYLAVATSDGIEVGFASHAAHARLIGPIGPVQVTASGMQRPATMRDAEWREMRAATGIVIRALLLGL